MKRTLFCLILIITMLSGCGGPYYFDLNLGPVEKGDKIKIDKILFVEDTNSSETYWTQRMVFRKDPYELEFFMFRMWAKRPSELVEDAVVHFYRNSSTFRKVTEEYSSLDPDITLKINVYSLEMLKYKKKWYGHLALDLEFIDKKSEKVIMAYSFDRKERIKGRKASYLPEKISLILREELVKAADKLALKL